MYNEKQIRSPQGVLLGRIIDTGDRIEARKQMAFWWAGIAKPQIIPEKLMVICFAGEMAFICCFSSEQLIAYIQSRIQINYRSYNCEQI